MSHSYYYFISTLPVLDFKAQAPISLEQFLEDAKRLLNEVDYADILAAVDERTEADSVSSSLLKEWKQFMQSCCNEGVFVRCAAENKNPMDYLRGERRAEGCIIEAYAQAAQSPDPLSAEKILDQMKWQCVHEMGKGHFFDMEFLIVYAIKLKMLERYKEISSPKGGELFSQLKEEALQIK